MRYVCTINDAVVTTSIACLRTEKSNNHVIAYLRTHTRTNHVIAYLRTHTRTNHLIAYFMHKGMDIFQHSCNTMYTCVYTCLLTRHQQYECAHRYYTQTCICLPILQTHLCLFIYATHLFDYTVANRHYKARPWCRNLANLCIKVTVTVTVTVKDYLFVCIHDHECL